MKTSSETWKPVPGYEGLYEASNLGRVCSTSRILKQATNRQRSGYRSVALYRDGHSVRRTVHALVLAAFVEPQAERTPGHAPRQRHQQQPTDQPPVRTSRDNASQCVNDGRHWLSKRTGCKHGHEFTPANTAELPSRIPGGRPIRRCRTCKRNRYTKRPERLACKRGHTYPPYARITSRGSRVCRVCMREHQRNYRNRKKTEASA